jgi:adenylate cyclase
MTTASTTVFQRASKTRDDRMGSVFLREEISREWLAFRARGVSLIIIGVWLAMLMSLREALYYHALILVFVGIGYGHYRVTAHVQRRTLPRLGLIAADFGLLAFTLLADNPLNDWQVPPPLRLENGGFAFFFVFLVGAAGYSAVRMIASGVIGAIAWASGYIWVALQPGSFTSPPDVNIGAAAWIEAQRSFNFVDLNVLYQDLIVFAIVTGILTLSVVRSRRLVLEQVQVARYFPPYMVDGLAGKDEPLGAVRTQRVAVLFADLVGFTRWAEHRPAGEIIGLLREVHSRLEACVFEHGGTLDKFLGDGLMATFGTPEAGSRDAANAIACGLAMVTAIDTWSVVESGGTRCGFRSAFSMARW